MYQFINGIAFEIILIILFVMGYLSMLGKIRLGWQGDDYEDWRQKNGKVVRMVCIMTIIVLLASIFAKYQQFFGDAPVPGLNT